jgi:nucleotide-binding universal stress UspA family protein
VRGFNIYQRRYDTTVKLDDERQWVETREMESMLEEARSRLIRSGFRAGQVTTKLTKGVHSRGAAIVLEAKEGGYGAIVLGRKGISRAREFSMGGVVRKVIRLASNRAVWVVS